MRACGLSGARVGAAKRARGPRVAFWAEVWAVRAGREAEAGRGVAVRSRAEREASWAEVEGRAGGSGPSERGVSWAGERKGGLGCCWAGVGPREGRGRPGLRWVWGLLGLGLGWVKGLGFLFPTLLLSKSNSSKV